jgi:hypothetical protein
MQRQITSVKVQPIERQPGDDPVCHFTHIFIAHQEVYCCAKAFTYGIAVSLSFVSRMLV